MNEVLFLSAGVFVAFVASLLVTLSMCKVATKIGLLDVPNQRSSHQLPTPRGGGIGIVVTTNIAVLMLSVLDVMERELAWAIAGGGTAIALIGFLDDRLSLSAPLRFAVHLASAAWAVYWLGGLPMAHLGIDSAAGEWLGRGLTILGIVWAVNLYNFMDGIDGLAGSQAVFLSAAGALSLWIAGSSPELTVVLCLFGAACAGFLVLNWSPARIFMGDVGSGYIGYVLALFALAAAGAYSWTLPVWLILGSSFVVDATVTLLRRLLNRENVRLPHKKHAYQILARRYGSHRKATIAVMFVNIAWLLPLALTVVIQPRFAVECLSLAVLPLTIMVIWLGNNEFGPAAPGTRTEG